MVDPQELEPVRHIDVVSQGSASPVEVHHADTSAAPESGELHDVGQVVDLGKEALGQVVEK